MSTISREQQVSLETTRYYHIISRCVRRAFLCGDDPLSGKDLNHRKAWLLDRIRELTSVFAIRVCAYAIMSNHYHIVVYLDREDAEGWSDEEVYERWKQLFKSRGSQGSDNPTVWRERLSSLSWFMRCLNETIARKANKEDKCKGRFWEGRFKSQALLDEGALLSCMAYVDLNPIRVEISGKPEDSEFTSILERIQQYTECKPETEFNEAEKKPSATDLVLFRDEPTQRSGQSEAFLPVSRDEYLALVDWSGRSIREGKKGSIPEDLLPILTRLELNGDGWNTSIKYFHHSFQRAAGNYKSLESMSQRLGLKWLKGKTAAKELYQNAA